MPEHEKAYTDIDYDSFPPADLDLDVHWIWLPAAVIRERRKAKQQAEEQARLAALPEDQKPVGLSGKDLRINSSGGIDPQKLGPGTGATAL